MSCGLQVLLFPAMKPEDQKAGALTSAAPPSAVQHPGPSSSLVTCPSQMPQLHWYPTCNMHLLLEHLLVHLIEHAGKEDMFCPSLWSSADSMLGSQRVRVAWAASLCV